MADGATLKPKLGELLPPFPRVLVQANPFTPATTREYCGAGTTIAEMVAGAGIPVQYAECVQVFLGDEEVNCALWGRVKPKPGAEVFIRVSLRGGDGGGKDVMRVVAMIAVMVVAMVVAPMLTSMMLNGMAATLPTAMFVVADAVIGAALMTAGTVLVNALIPPPTPKSQWGFDQELGNPYGQITGLRNQAAPYGPIPRVFGKRRMFPMLAGRPYTETVGNDQYLILLLLVGYGPLRLSDVKMGETPISNTPGIQMEIREGWPDDAPVTLYRKAIREDAYGVVLDGFGSETIKTTKPDTLEISLELSFPSGVNRVKDGELRFHDVTFSVQYRATGSNGAWINANWLDKNTAYGTQTNGQLFVRDKTQNGLRKSGRWTVPKGQYDVKVTRLSPKEPMGETGYALFTALRSIVDQPFLPVPGLSLMSLRMKASGQLNGVPDQINCVAEAYLPVYNGSSWSYQITRNPAWAYADLIRRRGLQSIHPDSRLDLPTIQSWAAACDAAPPNGSGAYWTFDGVMEGGSIFTGLRTAASHGRASFTIKDGKYSVVRDVQQTVPAQHISPRNSWAYNGSKVFTDVPHALRIRFPNEEKQYAEDEVIAYAPGYSEQGGGGTTAASKFETLDMPGCTRASQAWREGMYHLAVLMLRPETHNVTMDVENLRCTLGSFVRFSHDVIKIGLGWGRVKDRIVSGGNVTALILDGTVEMNSGVAYGIRCRRDDFASVVMPLTAFNGETDVVNLVTPLPLANAPEAGDLYQFGEANRESAPMMVKRIAPGSDLTAVVTLVDAQPGVWTADQGIIPPFDSYITSPTPPDRIGPPVPVMRLATGTGVAKYAADGTVIERIGVSFDAWPSGEVIVDSIEVQFRDMESPGFMPHSRISRDASGTFIETVQAGATYQVRARSLTAAGLASDWAVGQITAEGKTLPPSVPQALLATNGANAQIGFIGLSWTLSADNDLWGTEIWASLTNNRAQAVLVERVADPGTTFTHIVPMPAPEEPEGGGEPVQGNAVRYYWVRSLDMSGNNSSQNAAPEATPEDPAPNPDLFRWFPASPDEGVMGEALPAPSIELPAGAKFYMVVDVLPTTGNFEGRIVYLTTDRKLYVFSNGEWGPMVADVDVGDIEGLIKTVGALPASGEYLGQVVFLTTDKKLYRWDGTAWITGVTAGDLIGQLTSDQIASIEAAKIAGQITNAQIESIAAAKLAGQITNAQIEAIAAAKLTGAITETQITDGAISTPKLAAGSVETAKLAAGAITTEKLAALAITAEKISAGAIETAKIAAGAIIAEKIAALAITAAHLSAGSVEAAKIAAGAVIAEKIAAGAVSAEKIEAGAITTLKLAAGAVTADKIEAGAITTAKLAAEAVEAAQIKAGAITAGKIAANAITTDNIQAGAVDASKITVAILSALAADLGNITGGSINIGGGRFVVASNGAVTIKSALSGRRLEIGAAGATQIVMYNAGGQRRLALGLDISV